ncbi:MAG: glucosidase [Verrucomicrobia bacterium]|nr:glucosidase [Verrucomicrobiota bacterium]
MKNPELVRLEEARAQKVAWKKWGPDLSDRQWGTVREDYSENGDAWNFFTHDHARSRAYRWGEDGIAGISDDKQRLCFALALWNGKDPILKERLFGLTNSEGNHGEDVKEYYFYLDSTPTHSYMKCLYKYPQAAFPYGDLVETNRGRNRNEMEYELLDTGVFKDDRYFDVYVEYAKGGAEDILVKITAANRGPEAAELHLLQTLWFRNDWASWISESNRDARKPRLKHIKAEAGMSAVAAEHPLLGDFVFSCDGNVPLLFTENETNYERLFPGQKNQSPYVKDGINNCVVQGQPGAVNPEKQGTKVAAHYRANVGAGQTKVIRLRISHSSAVQKGRPFGKPFDDVFADRLSEADEFYKSVTPPSVSEDASNVMRQAIAGMLWSKQFFFFDGDNWLDEHNSNPLHSGYRNARNSDWFHMLNEDVISMPDKWEYPWYAAWDLAFHALPLSIVDPDFAKQQMGLMLRASYLHPSGQMPAYEWNFSDVNPPVHAFATLFLHRTEQALRGEVDLDFLKSTFNKLLLNFTWWVNRKDRFGKNVFEGGFLGLDNIGVFDRSAPLPTGGHLEQADGTAWMALFSQNMLELAIELAVHDPTYQDMVFKFVEHFYYIAAAMNRPGPDGMWDEEDGFYYDLLRLPDGSATRLKVRSMVGLLPLCAATVMEKRQRDLVPRVMAGVQTRMGRMPELMKSIHPTGPGHYGVAERGMTLMIIRSLLNFYLYYGDNFKIECPTGSGKLMNLFEVSKEISDRLTRIFLRNERGQRPVYGGAEKFQTDPHWRDHILFFEYFHGDNGAGLGASHQTGWTGLVAKLIQLYGRLDPKRALQGGKQAGFIQGNDGAKP